MKEQSQRQLRVGQQFRLELSNFLHKKKFDHSALIEAEQITVTEVSMSPDLKNAKAFVMQLAHDDMDDEVLDALNEVAPQIQGQIARALGMKSTPRLRFAEDTTYKTAGRVEQLLAGIKHSD